MSEQELAQKLAEVLDRNLAVDRKSSHPDDSAFQLAENLLAEPPFQLNGNSRAQLHARLAQIAQKAQPGFSRKILRKARWQGFYQVVGWGIGLIVFTVGLFLLFQEIRTRPLPATPQPAVIATEVNTSDAELLLGNFVINQTIAVDDNTTITLNTVQLTNDHVTINMCYQRPFESDWRLRDVSLIYENEELAFPSIYRVYSEDDFGMCSDFSLERPENWTLDQFSIQVGSLVTNTFLNDCALIQERLDESGAGIKIQCDESDPDEWRITTLEKPERMDQYEAEELVYQHNLLGYIGGPWQYDVDLMLDAEEGQPQPEVIIPSKLEVVKDSCQSNFGANGPFISQGYLDTPEFFAGGQQVTSGDYIFDLWLFCDEALVNTIAGGSSFSEINGLGVYGRWVYLGKDVEGGIKEYTGFEPFVRESGGMSTAGSQSSSALRQGLQFPAGVLPDFSRQNTRLRYVYMAELPDGTRSGAALSFTLQREAEGYRPLNIQVEVLSAEEMAAIEFQDESQVPFATFDSREQYPILTEVSDLIASWQVGLLADPGWLHSRVEVEEHSQNTLYGGLDVYQYEYWYHLDAVGKVHESVYIASSLDGKTLQQSIFTGGVSRNLTFGNESEQMPYKLDFAKHYTDQWLTQARIGGETAPQTVTWRGNTAWVFTVRDVFDPPLELEGKMVSAVENRDYLDPVNGQPLGTEIMHFTPEGTEELYYREVYTYTWVIAPPAEVLALLGAEFQGYQPPEPAAEPVPEGFDASGLPLHLMSYGGDDFTAPSFWLGDVLSGEYWLGRLDFGMTPGGWCQRSADGGLLAYLYQTGSNTTPYRSSVRWANLEDLTTVYQPHPDLSVVSHALSWSPVEPVFAYTACESADIGCGIYLVDTRTRTNRLLVATKTTGTPVLWNPAGTQLAITIIRDNVETHVVVDALSGTILFDGPASDSPVLGWGVAFSQGSEDGSPCFKN
jgi:hypothetical protein